MGVECKICRQGFSRKGSVSFVKSFDLDGLRKKRAAEGPGSHAYLGRILMLEKTQFNHYDEGCVRRLFTRKSNRIKCADCKTVFDAVADPLELAVGIQPTCPNCGSRSPMSARTQRCDECGLAIYPWQKWFPDYEKLTGNYEWFKHKTCHEAESVSQKATRQAASRFGWGLIAAIILVVVAFILWSKS